MNKQNFLTTLFNAAGDLGNKLKDPMVIKSAIVASAGTAISIFTQDSQIAPLMGTAMCMAAFGAAMGMNKSISAFHVKMGGDGSSLTSFNVPDKKHWPFIAFEKLTQVGAAAYAAGSVPWLVNKLA